MSLKDELDKYIYDPLRSKPPFNWYTRSSVPFNFCADPWGTIVSPNYKAKVTAPAMVYRIKRESGEVVALNRPSQVSIGGITVDLFQTYLSGHYATEEEARKAAVEYCGKAADKLTKATRQHREWLRERENHVQKFGIGDKVAHVSTARGFDRLRGLVKPVTGIRFDEKTGFQYRVDWDWVYGHVYGEMWHDQADLLLREKAKQPEQPEQTKPAEAKPTRSQPVLDRSKLVPEKPDAEWEESNPNKVAKAALDMVGQKARPKKEGGVFRPILKVAFSIDAEPVFLLKDAYAWLSRGELELLFDLK